MLEATRRVDTVVLDKTGTVTAGRMALVEVHVADGDRPRTRRCGWPAAVEAASEHPVAAAIVGGAPRASCPPSRASRTSRGSACRASSTATRCWSAARRCSTGGASRCRRRWPGRWPTRRPAGRTAVAVAWDGAARAVLVVADTVKPTSAEAVAPAARARPAPGAADRRQRGGRRRPSPTRSGSTTSSPTCCPPTRSTSSSGCRTRAGSSRWSATASTTPPRSPRPTSAWRWAPARTSRSRPPTSRWSAATCGPRRTRCGWPGARCARSRATCSGRSPTTSRRCRWRPPACSTR